MCPRIHDPGNGMVRSILYTNHWTDIYCLEASNQLGNFGDIKWAKLHVNQDTPQSCDFAGPGNSQITELYEHVSKGYPFLSGYPAGYDLFSCWSPM